MSDIFETAWPLMVSLIIILPGLSYISRSGKTYALSARTAKIVMLLLIGLFAITGGFYFYESMNK